MLGAMQHGNYFRSIHVRSTHLMDKVEALIDARFIRHSHGTYMKTNTGAVCRHQNTYTNKMRSSLIERKTETDDTSPSPPSSISTSTSNRTPKMLLNMQAWKKRAAATLESLFVTCHQLNPCESHKKGCNVFIPKYVIPFFLLLVRFTYAVYFVIHQGLCIRNTKIVFLRILSILRMRQVLRSSNVTITF